MLILMSESIISPNLQNSTKVAAGIAAKTMEKRRCVGGCVFGRTLEAPWVEKAQTARSTIRRTILGDIFH